MKAKPLSPEKYIITKSRTLKIDQCLINENWQKEGIAGISIIRKHNNGNSTIATFVVDLHCLGIKNTSYYFNLDPTETMSFMEHITVGYDEKTINIDYNLAHNIIFSGYEYALDLGFKPHPDFEKITKYFLEKDDENIPLIEVECGKDGKPFFIAGPFDNGSKINQVIKTLESSVGEGNFDYVLPVAEDFDYENEDNDYFKEAEEKFANFSIKELKEEFIKRENLPEEKLIETDIREDFYLTEMIFNDYLNYDEVEELNEKWKKDSELKSEYLFIKGNTDKSIMDIAFSNELVSNKMISKYRKKYGNTEEVSYLEYLHLYNEAGQNNFNGNYKEQLSIKIEEGLKLFPDSALYKIEKYEQALDVSNLNVDSVFGNRTEISDLEIMKYFFAKSRTLLSTKNIAGLDALSDLIYDSEIAEEIKSVLRFNYVLSQKIIVKQLIEDETNSALNRK